MEKTKKKTMVVAIIFAFAFLISALFIPKESRNIYATSSFDGDTLVGTTWVFDESIDYNSVPDASINFTCGETNYYSIYYFADKPTNTGLYYDELITYKNSSWISQTYRTISITGGTDAVSGGTNFAALVAWLNADATLQSGGNGGNGGSGATSTGVAEDIAFASATILMLGALLVVVAKKEKIKE